MRAVKCEHTAPNLNLVLNPNLSYWHLLLACFGKFLLSFLSSLNNVCSYLTLYTHCTGKHSTTLVTEAD